MTVLSTTTSVCPVCLAPVAAEVLADGDQVWMHKTCAEHGDHSTLLSSDRRLFWTDRVRNNGACSCMLNHSCTLIFEITEHCNLSCPTCYASSSPHLTWHMTLPEFEQRLDRLLRAGKADADMVQLSGGEPTLHPDIERMVQGCLERGVRQVYINTNGIRLATEPDFARRLAALDEGKGRVQFYLQFDGLEDATYAQLRGAAGLARVKERAVANALDAGLFVLPVMTVNRDVNLHEIGAVFRFMLDRHPRMNSIVLQPAFQSGRHDSPQPDVPLTLADVAHAVAQQSDGLFSVEDFVPIPCSHPNCFAIAVAIRHEGHFIPVSRYFPRFERWREPDVAALVAGVGDRLPQHMIEDLAGDGTIDLLLDLISQDDESVNWRDYRNFVLVGIKPFMDARSYDQARIDQCCVHIVDREGTPVSFCEYNTIRRPQGRL
jgi:tetraether lipid synthase